MNNFHNKYDQINAFKPIEGDPIILDFSGCAYIGQIHQVLKEKFGLPEYYGENWDALWDCLDGMFIEKTVVEIRGFATLEESLRKHCMAMIEVFEDVQKETPSVEFKLIS